MPAFVGYVAWMLFFYLFPSGRFVPRWTRWLALCWVFFLGSWSFTPFGPTTWPLPIFNVCILVLWGSFSVAQLYRYARVSNPTQRQQTKWIVYGVTVAVAGVLATIFAVGAAVDLRPEEVGKRMLGMFLMDAFMLALPISIGIAVLRSRLFDIDVVIIRTLVYGSLTLMLALVYLGRGGDPGSLPGAHGTAEAAAACRRCFHARDRRAVQNPLRRGVQAFIDRRFYRRKYDARKTLDALTTRLRDETNLDTLGDDVVEVVRETMQPAHASLWLRPRAGDNHGMEERAG